MSKATKGGGAALLPPEVAAACRYLSQNGVEADPAALWDYAVYDDVVVVIIATGQKYRVPRSALPEPEKPKAKPRRTNTRKE